MNQHPSQGRKLEASNDRHSNAAMKLEERRWMSTTITLEWQHRKITTKNDAGKNRRDFKLQCKEKCDLQMIRADLHNLLWNRAGFSILQYSFLFSSHVSSFPQTQTIYVIVRIHKLQPTSLSLCLAVLLWSAHGLSVECTGAVHSAALTHITHITAHL